MSTRVYVKQGDTAQPWDFYLRLNDAAMDCTGCTVKMFMEPVAGGTVIEKTLTAVNAKKGQMRYQPEDTVVGTAGEYHVEVRRYSPDGKPLTFPNGGDDGTEDYVDLTILAKLT